MQTIADMMAGTIARADNAICLTPRAGNLVPLPRNTSASFVDHDAVCADGNALALGKTPASPRLCPAHRDKSKTQIQNRPILPPSAN